MQQSAGSDTASLSAEREKTAALETELEYQRHQVWEEIERAIEMERTAAAEQMAAMRKDVDEFQDFVRKLQKIVTEKNEQLESRLRLRLRLELLRP